MSNKRGELYRNPHEGKIAGVCAGIADYFGWETWLVRILVVSGVLFGMPFLILGYVAGWFILDKKPGSQPLKGGHKFTRHNQPGSTTTKNDGKKQDDDYDQSNESIKVKARVWQSGEPPKQAFHDIRRKFLTLEKQLQGIEQYVTSTEFTVAREINKL